MKPVKICIVGAGQFAQCFVHLFQAHPLVSEVSLAELIPERRAEEAKRLGITRTFASLEEALSSDVDAVGIFTQRHLHAPMAIKSLNAGKHVYSCVPAGVTLEELEELIATVQRTGLTYMMGETSLYSSNRIFCQEKWDAGAFGHFVYGEGEYYHDMSHGFYDAYQYSGGADWKKTASYPPMLYPTHSLGMVLGTTGARATGVSCLGWKDRSDDGVFDAAVSLWKNDLSNQSALFRTSDGGMMRINEFRRIGQSGGRSVRLSIFGTEGSFEEQSNGAIWTSRTMQGWENVESQIACAGVYTHEQWDAVKVNEALKKDFAGGFAAVHQKYRSRLPESFHDQPNGHDGSHQFLADDFVKSVVHGTPSTCDAWDAARFDAPGIVAHQSALQGGVFLTIPDFGERFLG